MGRAPDLPAVCCYWPGRQLSDFQDWAASLETPRNPAAVFWCSPGERDAITI